MEGTVTSESRVVVDQGGVQRSQAGQAFDRQRLQSVISSQVAPYLMDTPNMFYLNADP